jgi:hypothetical protein
MSSDRLEDALSYLHELLLDPTATRGERIAAAKAIVSKDARESANAPGGGADQSGVVKLELVWCDDAGNPATPGRDGSEPGRAAPVGHANL